MITPHSRNTKGVINQKYPELYVSPRIPLIEEKVEASISLAGTKLHNIVKRGTISEPPLTANFSFSGSKLISVKHYGNAKDEAQAVPTFSGSGLVNIKFHSKSLNESLEPSIQFFGTALYSGKIKGYSGKQDSYTGIPKFIGTILKGN